MTRWTTYLPPVALVVLVVSWVTRPDRVLGVGVVAVFLVAAVSPRSTTPSSSRTGSATRSARSCSRSR